jgi:hypothetical protein
VILRGLLLIVCCTLSLLACKKKDNRPYSVWYINGERFSSNNVTMEKSIAVTALECDDPTGFYFKFTFDRNPEIFSSGYRFYGTPCYFTYQGKAFQAPYDTFFYRHPGNSKYQFTIDTAWVYNYLQEDTTHMKRDSVLVWGAFTFPE